MSGCEYLAGRAKATRRGGARVSVTTQMHDMGSFDPGSADSRQDGVVDFDTDRCRLVGRDCLLVLNGGTEYRAREDGLWTCQGALSGQRWSIYHPRWALEMLQRACGSAERVEPNHWRVHCETAPLAAISTGGLSGEWTRISADITLDTDERIIHVETTLATGGNNASGPRVVFTIELTEFATIPPEIDLPSPSHTVALAEYLTGPRADPKA